MKGGAVKHGVIHSRGERIPCFDADGATKFSDLDLLWKELDAIETSAVGVVVGSHGHMVKSESVVKVHVLQQSGVYPDPLPPAPCDSKMVSTLLFAYSAWGGSRTLNVGSKFVHPRLATQFTRSSPTALHQVRRTSLFQPVLCLGVNLFVQLPRPTSLSLSDTCIRRLLISKGFEPFSKEICTSALVILDRSHGSL